MKAFFAAARSKLAPHKKELLFVFLLLLASGVAHGWNMFHYPSYFDDEGTYMARAVAVAYHHSLAPYTYWYDHAPAGWILIAGWLRLTGGIHTFGDAINSGRVFMLIVHLLNTLLLYLIAKHYKLRNFFIAVIVGFFSFSPLAITLQRMVLLDNMMVLAMLTSLYLLLQKRNIYLAITSGILLGLAVLIKETAIFFIPGMLVLLLQKKPRVHRKFVSLNWLIAFGATVLLYPIFALLRGEFFEMHGFLGGSKPHVSLIHSLLWQNSRKGGAFYSPASQFMYSLLHSWLYADPWLIGLGALASLIMLIVSFWKRSYLPITLMTFGYIYYLLRGGIVNDQYLIPLLPLFALNIGLALNELYRINQRHRSLKLLTTAFIISVCATALFWDAKNADAYVLNATKPQVQAIDWLEHNTKPSDLTDIDSYAMGDLLYRDGSSNYQAHGYQDFWEIDQDPQLTDTTLHDNWQTITYALVTPRMLSNVATGGLPLSKEVLSHSTYPEIYKVSPPTGGISGYLYRESFHRQILIAVTPEVGIYKVNPKNNPQ